MLDPFQDQTQPADTLFRDVLSLALLGFLSVIVLLLPHISPDGLKNVSESPTPGNVVIEITWPDNLDADIDLWVKAPRDLAVGYSNKGGAVFNLLRDDLGKTMDLSSINHESAYSRGVQAGEYVVNAHAYRIDPKQPPPFDVEAVISTKMVKDGVTQIIPILFTKAQIRYQGQEITLARFKLTEDGKMVKGSVNSLFKPLRSTDKK
ncbi:MAG: hypothetical protein GKR96_03985 [Gammaproteobacteria bacterium]|nr:hypothetical protein [Gammaproteobacteria bacterium]